MDQDTIVFFREICKKVKERAEISDRFLTIEASKSKAAEAIPNMEKTETKNRLIPLSIPIPVQDWGIKQGDPADFFSDKSSCVHRHRAMSRKKNERESRRR